VGEKYTEKFPLTDNVNREDTSFRPRTAEMVGVLKASGLKEGRRSRRDDSLDGMEERRSD